MFLFEKGQAFFLYNKIMCANNKEKFNLSKIIYDAFKKAYKMDDTKIRMKKMIFLEINRFVI